MLLLLCKRNLFPVPSKTLRFSFSVQGQVCPPGRLTVSQMFATLWGKNQMERGWANILYSVFKKALMLCTVSYSRVSLL